MALPTMNSGRPAPIYRKTRNQSQWYDALLGQMIDGGLPFDAPIEAIRPNHREWLPAISDPLDRLLAGIMWGKVESQRRYCPHASTKRELLLVRNSTEWLLGDADCVSAMLRSSGQDTRCDSCGGDRPDQTPVTTFEIYHLKLITQLCSICRYALGI